MRLIADILTKKAERIGERRISWSALTRDLAKAKMLWGFVAVHGAHRVGAINLIATFRIRGTA